MKHSVCTSLQKLAAVPSKEKSALLVLGPNCSAWPQLQCLAPTGRTSAPRSFDFKFDRCQILPLNFTTGNF